MSDATRPCFGCDEPTTGSVGPTGLIWPMVCQKCKDEDDGIVRRLIEHDANVMDLVAKAMELPTPLRLVEDLQATTPN